MVKRLGILLLVCVTALLTVTAYWLLFTTFMAYDDEGYVLISLKNYSAHGGLYAQVFSQYGPFFYFLHDVGHRILGYEFTNTTGRLITLGCWMMAAGASAHLVWRETRAVTLTGFTLGLTFFQLRLMVSEPIHPGGMIAALVAVGAWGGAHFIRCRAITGLAVTAGLLGAALLLTKINVGVFFLMAAGAWFAIQFKEVRHARWAAFVAAGLLALLPFGLMRAELGKAPGGLFIGLSVVSSLTMLVAAWHERRDLTTWRHAGEAGAAAALLGLAVLVTVCLRGTTLHELLEGILLGPLRHPSVYHFPPDWKPGAAWVGGASLLLAGLGWNSRSSRLSWLLVGIRLVVVVGFSLACLGWIPFTSHSLVMSYGVPLAWIFVLRLDPKEEVNAPQNAAPWLGLLLVLQYLHAYPVAGTQIAWGTFLIVPLMALGLNDAQRFIGSRALNVRPAAIGVLCLGLAIGAVGRLTASGWHNYLRGRPLGLEGAEDIRLPEEFSSALRLITLNATAHGDILFSLPGQYSLNNWTRLPTPTLANATHWFTLLSRGQQTEIAEALSRSKHPVLIVQRYVLDFLKDTNFSVASPLHDYLQQDFECAFKLGTYEFWIRRGRIIARLGSAEILELKTPQSGLAPGQLELVVAIPAGRRIASIEIATFEESPQVLARWDKASGPLISTAIDLQGAVLATGSSFAWSQPLPPLVRLNLPIESLRDFDRPHVIVYLRDADGSVVAEARFSD